MFAAFRKKLRPEQRPEQRPETVGGADRRRDVRYQVELEGILESGGRFCPATVSDLSASGALVGAELALERGAQVILTVPELGAVPARVAHCGSGFFGLEFQNASEHRDRVNTWLRSQFGAGV